MGLRDSRCIGGARHISLRACSAKGACTLNILAIDPGTKFCGWARNYPKPASGAWGLASKRIEGPGMKYLRFQKYFIQAVAFGAELVIFEEVRSHNGVAAAHAYGGIVAFLMAYCEDKGVDYSSVPIGTWKKTIVGHGGSNPTTYLKFVQDHIDKACTSVDHAAALCILEWANREYGEESILS